jgi:hypothetical protein
MAAIDHGQLHVVGNSDYVTLDGFRPGEVEDCDVLELPADVVADVFPSGTFTFHVTRREHRAGRLVAYEIDAPTTGGTAGERIRDRWPPFGAAEANEAFDVLDAIADSCRGTAEGDRAQRAAEQWAAWLVLMRNLGAVVGCMVKYWPSRRPAGIAGPQRLAGRPLVTRAGFMSQSRGLSWDRNSRKGKK